MKMNKNHKTVLVILNIIVSFLISSCSSPKEQVRIGNGTFTIEGKDIQLICGEMHYPRIPHEYWRDRLKRASAMGLNTVSAYVFWNFHERQPGEFDFSGQADIAEFIRTAQEEGLYVILRPGPYVCAEWDFGGYPSWLLKEKDMTYRSKDPRFLSYCERYIKELGKQLSPLTINNGGNIIMVQVENEYGSYAADKEYLAAIRDMIKEAGFNVPLFTCDGGGQVEAGHVEGALPTLNGVFGEDIFKVVDKYQKGGPYFVAEFYPAWFDEWGRRHSSVAYERPAEQLDWMLSHGVSVSMYMFHGGTNFEYTNGANTGGGYQPQPTSYDYDAPLGEWGNCYPKYHAFREVIQKYLPAGTVLPEVPADNPTTTFATVELKESAPLRTAFHQTTQSENVLSMEDLGVDFGYIHYQTTLQKAGKQKLVIQDLRDYAVILIDGKQVASLDRRYNQNSVTLNVSKTPATLEILVENTGRVNYGPDILFNRKGITSQVLWGNEKLAGWSITPLPLYKEKVSEMEFGETIKGVPAFHKGTFTVEKKGDCFVDMSQWGKGAVWVNGKSLGRFWNIGPQQTLYLPAPWLKEGENEIIVLDLKGPEKASIRGLKKPILDWLRNEGASTHRKEGEQLDLSRETPVAEGTFVPGNGWQEVCFDRQSTGRYFCLEALSAQKGKKIAAIAELDVLGADGKPISREKWRIRYADSEETRSGNCTGDKVFDLQESTYWMTVAKDAYPHQLVIDLGGDYTVTGFRYLPRAEKGYPGMIKDYRVYVKGEDFQY